jgi:hypothetical protein
MEQVTRAGERRPQAARDALPVCNTVHKEMPHTRRHRKLGRWRRETFAGEAPLDEVPSTALRRISIPGQDVPGSQRSVDADAAALAVALRELRRQLRRARWIPWRRRKRSQLRAQIEELVQQRRRLRADRDGPARRL